MEDQLAAIVYTMPLLDAGELTIETRLERDQRLQLIAEQRRLRALIESRSGEA